MVYNLLNSQYLAFYNTSRVTPETELAFLYSMDLLAVRISWSVFSSIRTGTEKLGIRTLFTQFKLHGDSICKGTLISVKVQKPATILAMKSKFS